MKSNHVDEMKLQPTDSLHGVTFRSIATNIVELMQQLRHFRRIFKDNSLVEITRHIVVTWKRIKFVQLAAKCDESVSRCSQSSMPSSESTRHFTPPVARHHVANFNHFPQFSPIKTTIASIPFIQMQSTSNRTAFMFFLFDIIQYWTSRRR